MFEQVGLFQTFEERKQRRQWQHPAYYDVTLLSLEELCLTHSDPSVAQKLIVRAAQEFGKYRRGISFDADAVTVIGAMAEERSE